MDIEFTANELHTIAGALYPDLNSTVYANAEELSLEELESCQALILGVGRCIINDTGLLSLEEWQVWDIRDAVPYTALMGPEATGRSIHKKLWMALLKMRGYSEVHYGDIEDAAYSKSSKDSDQDTNTNETT